MDVRGIEVTNQLRSAIRAKLLELGVRYDEELPDYILVMVVNKKSRQQMHEDLFLFLEDSTTPFVDWLHDQVLKKLQKVTVAKKKTPRELLPSVIVKQEEERKKRKSTTSFLDDQIGGKLSKDDKQLVREAVQLLKEPTESASADEASPESSSVVSENQESRLESEETPQEIQSSEEVTEKTIDAVESPEFLERNASKSKGIEEASKSFKEPEERSREKRKDEGEDEEEEEEEEEESLVKLRSSITKPRITSVVSAKTRVDVISPRKTFDTSRDRGFDSRHRQNDRRPARTSRSSDRRNNFPRNRNAGGSRNVLESESSKRSFSDIRSRLGNAGSESREKSSPRSRANEKSSESSIKDRLGSHNPKSQKQEVENSKNSDVPARSRNIKNRLGPIRNNFRSAVTKDYKSTSFRSNEVEKRLGASDLEEEEEEEVAASLKSRIIAVKNAPMILEEEDEDQPKDCKVPSKVIVTPRPLKPLQPIQKRATQSLLLRAVAEANQSVVMQKNPEPALPEKKPVQKRLRVSESCQVGNNLSVHLNDKSRFVMEKIQIELTTGDAEQDAKSQRGQQVSDEHLGVVMSLFQRGDDNQKFLVTLNGYNNNVHKETLEDEEEGLEVEVNEDDELTLSNSQVETCMEDESSDDVELDDSTYSMKEKSENNNENRNIENVEYAEDKPRKKRKLSPIVYNRSPTRELKRSKPLTPTKIKKPIVDSNVIVNEKSKEKCRYWPGCTLGSKCAFYHPGIPCSAFPACKYGDKCAYKHPKCKFGISCTRQGCVFSHPSQQCKYHPFCTKPGCSYTHPLATPTIPSDITQQRAKFTWKRHE